MMNREIPSQEQEQQWNLDSFTFASVDWTAIPSKERENGSEQVIQKSITVDGTQFPAVLQRQIHGHPEVNKGDEKIDMHIGGKDAQVHLTLLFIHDLPSTIIGRTNIRRLGKKEKLPPTTGTRLYAKALEEMQHHANISQKPVQHIVERDVAVGEKQFRLTREEWDNKLGSILRAAQYRNHGSQSLEKTYQPE